MGALYTNYASSHVFGTELESPNALRAYAEALLRTAHEEDPGQLPDNKLVDWVNRVRGEDNAFTCTSVCRRWRPACHLANIAVHSASQLRPRWPAHYRRFRTGQRYA
jgi:hypothetical protein